MFGITNKIKIQSDDVFGKKYLTIVSNELQKTIETIYKQDIKTIVIKTYEGYGLKDLEWLKNCPFINQVHLFCYEDNFKLQGLHYLKGLEFLNLNVTAKKGLQGLDFDNFPKLQNCSIDWNPKMKNLFNCASLQRLNLRKYKGKDLNNVGDLSNLTELVINTTTIESLIRIEGLNINRLELVNMRKLVSLKGVESLYNLKVLEMENCSKVESIDNINTLLNLEKLGLNNCKEIETLNPIRDLKKLQWLDFWGNTSIQDGDMTPCIGIQKVAFENRKHYNYKNEEIDKLNQGK